MPTVIDPYRIRRKLRKLQRDPRAFFRDTKVPLLYGLYQKLTTFTVDTEPRFLGSVVWTMSGIEITRLSKRVAEHDIASVVFTPKAQTPLRERPYLCEMLASSDDFVGFRDRYLFAFEYDLEGLFAGPDDIADLYKASNEWGRSLTAGVRNIIFFDPPDVFPFLVRSTHSEARLIICASNTAQLRALAPLAHQIDVLVTTKTADDRVPIKPRRRILVDDPADFTKSLKAIIIDHKQKEKNVLLPVWGEPTYLDDIDDLNERNVDAVLFLSEPCPMAGRNLLDLVREIVPRTRFLLLREVSFRRYIDMCNAEDLEQILLASLEDGCRYEVRT